MSERYISEIVINNFRNYLTKKLDFSNNINVIYGDNGVGKTSILEAIYFFEELKSFRKSDILDIANSSGDINPFLQQDILFSLYIKFFNFDTNNSSSIVYKKDGDSYKKIVKINNDILKKNSQLKDIFKITYLIPQMDQFFTDQSSVRRKFLDKTASLLFIDHYDAVKKYEFFIKERLRILTGENVDKNWLNIVEKKIVELGVSIASIRNETINIMNNIFSAYNLSFPVGVLEIDGVVENMLHSKKSIEVEGYYLNMLLNNRVTDANLKKTNFGIHKSDLILIHKDKNIKANLCSTGEQKLLLIALMFVRCIFSKNINKGISILLLDDIVSHLDSKTRNILFSEIKNLNVQTFITGIDVETFKNFNDVNFISLK